MECGCCGAGFSKCSKDSFGCSAARNKGAAICTNMRLIKQKDLEAAVLEALGKHLIIPEAWPSSARKYTAERNRLAAKATEGRGALEKELAQAAAQPRQVGGCDPGKGAGRPGEGHGGTLRPTKELEHHLSRTGAAADVLCILAWRRITARRWPI